MKREEIIILLATTCEMLDQFNGAEMKDAETGETVGSVAEGDIRGMETALAFCAYILRDDFEPITPINLAMNMIRYHGAATSGLLSGETEASNDD